MLTPFSDLTGNYYLGIGTSLKYYIERGGSMYDITPIRTTITQSNPFSTTAGSNVVTVTIPAHGATASDFVTFSGASPVGGLTLNGEYQIVDVITSSVFTIQAIVPASSTAVGGGSVTAVFQINTGLNATIYANGFGAGTWGGVLPGTSVTFQGSIAGTTLTVSSIVAGASLAVGQLVSGTGVSASPPGSSATYISVDHDDRS